MQSQKGIFTRKVEEKQIAQVINIEFSIKYWPVRKQGIVMNMGSRVKLPEFKLAIKNTSCVMLQKSFDHSLPQFCYLWNGDNAYLIGSSEDSKR